MIANLTRWTTKPVLLLVDDNEEILSFLKEDLEEDYNVLTACDGEEALSVMDNSTVQLIISDVMMPKMDGYALCNHLKNDDSYSHIPLILLTAKDTLQSKITGLELGADAYVEKPFSPEFLQVQIANLLASRMKLKQHFSSSLLPMVHNEGPCAADAAFLSDLERILQEHLHEESLDVEQLASHLCMSRPTLYRRIKSLSQLTPNELINLARLRKSAELLSTGQYKIYEVAEQVGYSSQTHFGRNFHKQFGMSPSEYLVSLRN